MDWDAFKQTYNLIRKNLPLITIDSLEAVTQVEMHRQFWKPNITNVVLLAESHVYTDKKDTEIKMKKSTLSKLPENYPSSFVRFVYCLGYGENDILTKKPSRRNSGTVQFWKIFCSCIAENNANLGFEKVLKRRTKLGERLQNKLNVLQQMKEKGIWLLDASIVGLYGNEVKRGSRKYRQILEICWENYLKKIVEAAQPKQIIIIGKKVEESLQTRLNQLEIQYETIDQPQTHLKREQQIRNYQRYNEICSSVIKRKQIKKQTEKRNRTVPKVSYQNKTTTVNQIEENLYKKGYTQISRNTWQKNEQIIHISKSRNFGTHIRITWKEKWKKDYAIIFDYSQTSGPTCIVPINELFNTEFVQEKRQQKSYTNSGYWWTQIFSFDKPLAQFVLSYKDRWDIL
jgi:hypothetical protein